MSEIEKLNDRISHLHRAISRARKALDLANDILEDATFNQAGSGYSENEVVWQDKNEVQK